jgi:hypothetical protein
MGWDCVVLEKATEGDGGEAGFHKENCIIEKQILILR